MGVEISVICLTYNSDINKLLTTLNSVIQQKNCRFEIIIADDGSGDNKFEEVETFLSANDFQNYKLIPNAENKGIIKNFLSAIQLANGRYIKYISPGDYLYDENTLEYIYEFMKKYDASIAFGKAVYYSDNSGELDVFNLMAPVVTDIYDVRENHYNYDDVLKHIMLFDDVVLGAVVVAKRDIFEKYLLEISSSVVYIEDNTILPLVTLDKQRIFYMDRYILWYESDSGISTNVNRGFIEKIEQDMLNCYKYISNKYPSNNLLRLAYLKRKYLSENSRIASFFVKRIIDFYYGRILFKFKRRKIKKNYIAKDFDRQKYYKWQIGI